MNKDLPEENCYVRAICNYKYHDKGKDVSMAKDEVFFLFRKATQEWWQVIRSGDKKTFYAPSKYLEVTEVSSDTMKSSLRKKIAHQRHLQNQQRLYEESRKQNQNQDENSGGDRSKGEGFQLIPTEVVKSAPCEKSVKTSHENYVAESDDRVPRLKASLHQKEVIEPPTAFLDANKNESLHNSSFSCSESRLHISSKSTLSSSFSDDNINEKLDSRFSDSFESFNDSFKSSSNAYEKISICSTPEKHGLSSELESISTHTSKSSLNDASRSSVESFSQMGLKCSMVGKSASFDVLQSGDEGISPLNVSSHQKAASSEELDRRNRRKEYLFQSERLNHRNRSNSVDLKRFDNNLDLSECERLTSLEKSRKCRITRDPMNRRRSWALNESHSLNSFCKSKPSEQDVSMILDMPPKLPPKLKKNSSNLLSFSSDNLQKMDPPIDLRIEANRQRLAEEKAPFSGAPFPLAISSLNNSQNSSQESLGRERKDPPVALPRKVVPPLQEDHREAKAPPKDLTSSFRQASEKLSGWKVVQGLLEEKASSMSSYEERSEESLEGLNGREERTRENRVEQMIDRIQNQTKMAESSFKSKGQIQSPPTPTDPPRRIVFDDWGEYLDRESNRPFYYNSKTLEKRWKPPRKSICSSLTTDSPPSLPKENKGLNASLRPIKIPSPVLPPTSHLWPNRERSFTTSSPPSSLPRTHPAVAESASLLLPSSSTSSSLSSSLTLPSSNPPPSTGVSKACNTLPPNPAADHKDPSPTAKSSRSFFSTISNSLSFIKHSSNNNSHHQNHNTPHPHPSSSRTPPQVPPSSAKPSLPSPSSPRAHLPEVFEEQLTLQHALERFRVPPGWTRKYDALSHQVFFQSLVTGEKWNPAIDKTGTVYVYSASGGDSKWTLQEYEDLPSSTSQSPPLSPVEREKGDALVEDILVWRLCLKEGKKVKKSWVTSYARYVPNTKKTIYGRAYGTISFSKKPNDTKKVEHFDLVPPCYVDFHLKKQNSLCLRNGDFTEILLQAESPSIATHWTKLLIENDKIQEKKLTVEKDKKSVKVPDKSLAKKDSLEEESTKGIKDSLMLFFKRRMQQETLAKKGIYKDTVFGSSIGDLCLKEQLNTPVFVLQCIKNIEKNKENFQMDGLYRISGNSSKIQKIRIEIAQNRYAILEEEKDVHNLTGALKLFFRELKEPLIPFANYQSFIQATDHMKSKPPAEALRVAIKKLPACNRETLKILIDHLLKVNEYESENRMSVMNLAIVFGPCLLWPETTSGFDLMTDAMLHNRVVEALLSLADKVFVNR